MTIIVCYSLMTKQLIRESGERLEDKMLHDSYCEYNGNNWNYGETSHLISLMTSKRYVIFAIQFFINILLEFIYSSQLEVFNWRVRAARGYTRTRARIT